MVVLLCVSKGHHVPGWRTMFPMRVEGATERWAHGSAGDPCRSDGSLAFRTCVPRDSGRRLAPLTCGSRDLGFLSSSDGAVDAHLILATVSSTGRAPGVVMRHCPRLPMGRQRHRRIMVQVALTSDGFDGIRITLVRGGQLQGPGHRRPTQVSMVFDVQLRIDSSLARQGQRVADSSAGHDR